VSFIASFIAFVIGPLLRVTQHTQCRGHRTCMGVVQTTKITVIHRGPLQESLAKLARVKAPREGI